MSIDLSRAGRPFEDQDQLLDSFSEILDLHIYYLYKYHTWVSPNNNMQNMLGVVVSREEFESNLLRASDSVAYGQLTEEEIGELDALREYFLDRYNATVEADAGFPLVKLGTNFSMDFFEYAVTLTLFCCELDKKYEKIFVFLQDDIAKKTLSVETAIHLWAEPGDRISSYYQSFSESSVLAKYICPCQEGTLSSRMLNLSKAVTNFFSGDRSESGYEYFSSETQLAPMVINRSIAEQAIKTVQLSREGKVTLLHIVGKQGSGRRFLVKHCAAAAQEGVIFVSASALVKAESVYSAFGQAVCTARLEGCALCVTDFELFLEEEQQHKLYEFSTALREASKHLGTHLYITSEQKWQESRLGDDITRLDLELADTDEEQRLMLWEHYMRDMAFEDGVSAQELAAKFRFTAGQIQAAADRASELTRLSGEKCISSQLLHNSCYDQVVVGLNTLASPIKPAYDWDDLVLPQSEIKQLKDACMHIRYRHTVYNEWGFGKKAAYGRGLSILFSGPPGTGKTMAAQVITNQLHMKLYKIQLSQIISKYIGETEKNLKKVFTEAKNANCVLFFDEMDALFGKRSEVKDSHDRHANIETAYLLQQMEEYDGVVLMATNLLQNIDEAFMRRISFVVSFPFPDAATRTLLWKKMFDANAPMAEDIDYDFLAEAFKIAGGNIKNCVVHAAFLAASEGVPISMRHILRSVVKEQRKNNVIVLKEDLREYADLVFGTE